MTATTPSVPTTVDPAALRQYLDGRWREVREQARELAVDPRFAVSVGADVEQQRADVLQKLHALAGPQYSGRGFPSRYGGQDDVGGSITAFEMLGFGDLSLLVKAGVQWGLFGGAVLHLGTRGHHDRYLADIVNGELLGCFAMTETGHGSDVAHVRTTATYDAQATAVRHQHTRRRRAQGVHRQRRPRRTHRRRVRPADHARRGAGRGRRPRPDPRRRRRRRCRACASRTAD